MELKNILLESLRNVETHLPAQLTATPPTSGNTSLESPVFQCALCSMSSRNRGALRRHVADQHFPQKVYRCPVKDCSREATRKDSLRNHYRSHGLRELHASATNSTELDDRNLNDYAIEYPSPPHCAVCASTVGSWDTFYTCFISHCTKYPDNDFKFAEHQGSFQPNTGSLAQERKEFPSQDAEAATPYFSSAQRHFQGRTHASDVSIGTSDYFSGSTGGSLSLTGAKDEPLRTSKQRQGLASTRKPYSEKGKHRDDLPSGHALSPAKKRLTDATIPPHGGGSSSKVATEPEIAENSNSTDSRSPTIKSEQICQSSCAQLEQPGELDHLLNPTAYFEKLDELEIQTAKKLGLDSGPNTHILSSLEIQKIAEESQGLVEILRAKFTNVLDEARNALCHLQSRGFCGSTFSILVEDQFRPQIAKVVRISLLNDIDGSNTSAPEAEIALALFETVLGYEGKHSENMIQASEPLIYNFIRNFLPLALVSFTGSHVCPFDMNLWGRNVNKIPVGLDFSIQSRELACLKDFIGGPAWVLARKGEQEVQRGLKVSLTVQDLQELWGPVWLVGGTANECPFIRTERGFIVPLPRSEQTFDFEESGEINCHWTTSLPEYVDTEDRVPLSSTSRILIGTESMTVTASGSGLVVNSKCKSKISDIQQHVDDLNQFQFPGTCNEYYKMESHEVQVKGGPLAPVAFGFKRKRMPATKHKDRLIGTCLSSRSNIWNVLNLRIGLEISACTGNAQRVTLWDALRLSQTKEMTEGSQICKHEIADPRCIERCWNKLQLQGFTRYSKTQNGQNNHDLTEDQLYEAMVISLQALEHTGIDKEGNLQACWPFLNSPTNRRIVRNNKKWFDAVVDTRDMSTFAVVSQRCLDFRDECSKTSLGSSCRQRYLETNQETCLSLRVLPRPLSQEESGNSRLNVGLRNRQRERLLTDLTHGSQFCIANAQLYVKDPWARGKKFMVAYTGSSFFDLSSRLRFGLEFREQLNPEIKGSEPVNVIICSKAYSELRPPKRAKRTIDVH